MMPSTLSTSSLDEGGLCPLRRERLIAMEGDSTITEVCDKEGKDRTSATGVGTWIRLGRGGNRRKGRGDGDRRSGERARRGRPQSFPEIPYRRFKLQRKLALSNPARPAVADVCVFLVGPDPYPRDTPHSRKPPRPSTFPDKLDGRVERLTLRLTLTLLRHIFQMARTYKGRPVPTPWKRTIGPGRA